MVYGGDLPGLNLFFPKASKILTVQKTVLTVSQLSSGYKEGVVWKTWRGQNGPLQHPLVLPDRVSVCFLREVLSSLSWIFKRLFHLGSSGTGLQQQGAYRFCESSAQMAMCALREVPMSVIGDTQHSGRGTQVNSLSGQILLPRQTEAGKPHKLNQDTSHLL